MVDSSPLLSESDSDDSQKQISLDETIESCLGNFGWVQLLQAVLVSFSWVFDAQQAFISVFTDSSPSWHCLQLSHDLCNQCRIPKNAWTWDEPIQTSIISEWDLACAGPFITALPTSSFFLGCLVGGFVLATLADSSLGRKNMLVLACLIMSLAGVLTVFSPNVWVYSFLRFITGFGRATIGTCALVLSSELVGKRWRGEVGVIGFFCFTIGFLSLPGIAYMTRASPSWRTLYLWTSVPAIGYSILVYFIGHESPRWLLIHGRKEEALKTLLNMSTSSTNSTIMSIDISSCNIEMGAEQREETWNSRMKMLWVKRWAFKRLMTVMVVGFGNGMVYYGMPLGLSSLDFNNLYLSVTLNALSELPASLIALCLIGKLNRRSAIMVFSMVSGVFSILCVVVGNIGGIKKLQIGMELVSFFSGCTSFNVLLIYTLELFPTSTRNTALSMVRQAIMLGGMLSPVLVTAAREDGQLFLSYGVFGVAIGCCGFLVVWLPETRGRNLCDTMDEQEEYKGINASAPSCD